MDKSQKRNILLLMTAMFFLACSATDIYISSLPEMVAYFNSSVTLVNLTLSCYFLSVAIAVLFVGEISNRFGRRVTLLYGVAVFSITSLLIGVIPNLWIIIFLRVIQAVGCAAIIIITRLILKDCMDEKEQITANGILSLGLMVSPAIAPVIGAYLATYFGWESCFWFSAVFGLWLLIIGYFILPETLDRRMDKFHPVKHYINVYIKLFHNRLFLVLTSVYANGRAVFYTFIGISSYLYIDYWHISPKQYSLLYILLSAAYLIGNQIMQWCNRKEYSAGRMIQVGTYSTMIGCLIIASALFIHIIIIKLIVVTLGVLFMRAANALINPPTQVLIMKYFEGHSAQALGLNMSVGWLVSSAAVWVVTLFASEPYMGLLIVSGFFVVMCVITYELNHKVFSLDN